MKKLWCADFLKGNCKHGENCMFPHVSEEAVKAIKVGLDNTKAKGKAQAKPKGKAQPKKNAAPAVAEGS